MAQVQCACKDSSAVEENAIRTCEARYREEELHDVGEFAA